MRWRKVRSRSLVSGGLALLVAPLVLAVLPASAASATTGAPVRGLPSASSPLATFSATLTWDQPGDDDLWVTGPSGVKTYYGRKTTDDGSLSTDDTSSTGPEVFTATPTVAGNFLVQVNCYARCAGSTVTVVLQLPRRQVTKTHTMAADETWTAATVNIPAQCGPAPAANSVAARIAEDLSTENTDVTNSATIADGGSCPVPPPCEVTIPPHAPFRLGRIIAGSVTVRCATPVTKISLKGTLFRRDALGVNVSERNICEATAVCEIDFEIEDVSVTPKTWGIQGATVITVASGRYFYTFSKDRRIAGFGEPA
jgi:hypothetical protein